jgi:hypothetical protein
MERGCALDGSTSTAWISEDWQRRNGEATGSFGTAPSRNGWFDGSLVRERRCRLFTSPPFLAIADN